jgi:deferrochelatase/peroxidase EfeB
MADLDRKVAEAERDKEEYQKFLAKVQASLIPPPISSTAAAAAAGLTPEELAEEAELARQEAELEEQLTSIRREKQALAIGQCRCRNHRRNRCNQES